MGGHRGLPVRGFRSIDYPRDDRFPNIESHQTWSRHVELANWIEWADIQNRLQEILDRASRRNLPVKVEIGVDPTLPYDILIRLHDVVQYQVPATVRAAGVAEFQTALLSSVAIEPQFADLRLIYLPETPHIGEIAGARTAMMTAGALVRLDGAIGLVSMDTGVGYANDSVYSVSIQRIVRRQRSRARQCYRRFLEAGSAPGEGHLEVDIIIGGDGSVAGLELVEDTMGEDVGVCVRRELEDLSFPATPDGTSTQLTFRFAFSTRR